jgi:hypothetical protein
MSHSITEQTTVQEYASFPAIWNPHPIGKLFLIKVPPTLNTMTDQIYETLLLLRIQWLIQTWMERTGENQPNVHSLLCQTLRELSSTQEPPSLYEMDEPRTFQPLWWWKQEWAATFVHRNETLLSKARLEAGVSLPCPIAPLSDPQLILDHNNLTLADWLTELSDGMSDR